MLFRYQQQPSALVQGAWGTPRVQRGTFPCTATFSSTVIVQAKRVALTGVVCNKESVYYIDASKEAKNWQMKLYGIIEQQYY